MEIWKIIEDNNNYYISNFARFKKVINGKEIYITGWIDRIGYRVISYDVNGKRKRNYLHIHVAKYFIENNNINLKIVNHIDGNKLNNISSNLEWTNAKGNRIHAVEILNVGKRQKSITQYDSNNNVIKIFKSTMDASKELNIPHQKIYQVCTGKRNHYKKMIFKYTFIDNNDELDKEEWKILNDYDNKYEVSNFGRIRNIKSFSTKRILKQTENGGYMYVNLCNDGIEKSYRIHRLVAKTFINNPNNLSDVHHIDHNGKNNCVTNLQWLSHADNCKC